jgi:glycosyltransferase involved in cell wall biosynthesis
LIKGLDRTKFAVSLAAPNDGPLFAQFAGLCPVHEISVRGFYPAAIRTLRRLVRKDEIDLVHTHGKGASLYGRLASLGSKTKTVYTLHGFDAEHYGLFLRYAYLSIERMLALRTDRFVAVSVGEKNKAQKAGILPLGRSTVIFNGIEMNGESTRCTNGQTIGTLSRTCYQKGLEFLIDAVALLKDKFPGLACYIAGGTPKGQEAYEAALKDRIEELKVRENIIFLGEISDVTKFLSKIDVYVSTSRWEGLPTAILEAQAARVPVVASNVVGNTDLVKNGETGILVRACDGKSAAAGIEYALCNPVELGSITAAAFRNVAQDYSVGAMVHQHEVLYEYLLGAPSFEK